jgi:hypothetical protein
MFGLSPESRQPHRGVKHRNGLRALHKKHTSMERLGLFCRYGDDESGGSMSRAERDEAIIAFLLFCLEMYQTEQQRKRKMH